MTKFILTGWFANDELGIRMECMEIEAVSCLRQPQDLINFQALAALKLKEALVTIPLDELPDYGFKWDEEQNAFISKNYGAPRTFKFGVEI